MSASPLVKPLLPLLSLPNQVLVLLVPGVVPDVRSKPALIPSGDPTAVS